MRVKLLSCISLPPATITSIPIYDYAIANEELAKKGMEQYNPCCGKKVCGGCIYSFRKSGNGKCPFCNPDRCNKTDEEMVEELMKRVEVNDAGAICMLANFYHHGRGGLQQDQTITSSLRYHGEDKHRDEVRYLSSRLLSMLTPPHNLYCKV